MAWLEHVFVLLISMVPNPCYNPIKPIHMVLDFFIVLNPYYNPIKPIILFLRRASKPGPVLGLWLTRRVHLHNF